MKNFQIFLPMCALSVLICSAAEQPSLTNIPLSKEEVGRVSAIAHPTQHCILVGSKNGCFLVGFNKEGHRCELINHHKTFAMDAKDKKVVIANARGLAIFDVKTDAFCWDCNDIPTKKMSVVFGKENTILGLDAQQQLLRMIDYEKNTEQVFSIDCCKPEHMPTALLSYCMNTNAIAYINKDQNTSTALLSDPITPKTFLSDMPQYNREALCSPSGKKIAITNWNNGVVVWNIDDNTEITNIDRPVWDNTAYPIESILVSLSLAFHPDGTLAILSNPGVNLYNLDFYNLETGKQTFTKNNLPINLTNRKNPITYLRRLAFSPKGKFLAVLGDDNILIMPVSQDVIAQQDSKQ